MNIFEQGKAMSITNFFFIKVGDEVQGTYIGKREKDENGNYERDPKYGNEIITYEFQTPSGIVNVPFSYKTKLGKVMRIHEEMAHVNFGQIIGIKFVEKGANGVGDFKNIKVFADKKYIDEGWVKAHANGSNDSGLGANAQPNQPSTPTDDGFGAFGEKKTEPEPFISEGSSVEAKLKAISELAKTKLGVIDPARIKDVVMEKTELAFIQSNYVKIIQILKNL